jgi:hypothetical protein
MAVTGDIVLVYYEDEPAFFARIEDVTPDHKPHWSHVKLLVLQIPIIEIVWILREEYLKGVPFTMGGHTIRMELVTGPQASMRHVTPNERHAKHKKKKETGGKVIPLFEK